MAGFTDFLAGCVVGGALVATDLMIGRRASAENYHVAMLKDDSTATVWSVDRATGRTKFVSAGYIPVKDTMAIAREGARRVGETMVGMGSLQGAAEQLFGGMAEGALRAQVARNSPAR